MSRRARFEAEERRRKEEFKANMGMREKQYKTDLIMGLGGLGIRAGGLYQDYQKSKTESPLQEKQLKGVGLRNEILQHELDVLKKSNMFIPFPGGDMYKDPNFVSFIDDVGKDTFKRKYENRAKSFVEIQNGVPGMTSGNRQTMVDSIQKNPDEVVKYNLLKVKQAQSEMAFFSGALKALKENPDAGKNPKDPNAPPPDKAKLQKGLTNAQRKYAEVMMGLDAKTPKVAEQIRRNFLKDNMMAGMNDANLDSMLTNMLAVKKISKRQAYNLKETWRNIQIEKAERKKQLSANQRDADDAMADIAIMQNIKKGGKVSPEDRRRVGYEPEKETKPPARKIVKGADGYNRYADTGERVFPGVEKPEKETKPPRTRTIKRGGVEVTEEFNKETKKWKEIGTSPQWRPRKKGDDSQKNRRQWNKDSDGYLNKLITRMSKEGMPNKEIRKFREKVILGRSKYRNKGDDYDVGTMQTIKEILAETPPKEKSKHWYDFIREMFRGGDEAEEEPPATPETAIPVQSAEDIEFTAKKHGITVEEVKRRLGIQ